MIISFVHQNIMTNQSILHTPIKIGAWDLPNRIIMAPLTRRRASEGRVPNALMAEHYAQRASAGLIITEATSVSPMGVGYSDTPGIWSDDQVKGWKLVTEAVHEAGGRIILQLWHVGRISDPSFLDGKPPVGPSAIAASGNVSILRPERPFETPHALTVEEIAEVVETFRKGAENAMKAGFDGVEIHGANGYLLDQFLQTSSNQREDEYGGSVENRGRLILEVVDAASSVWGANRVGLHLAPAGDMHDMGDDNPEETFSYIAKEAGKRGLAFIFAREEQRDEGLGEKIKELFNGPFIANENLTKEQAEELIQSGKADAASWGKLFIVNPDLVERFSQNAEMNEADPNTFYGGGAEGYTDYPRLG